MKIGDKVRIVRDKVMGTIVDIDPENLPYTVKVKWSEDSFGWYIKSILRRVK